MPGKGTPAMVAAFCCWKRLSACGTVFVEEDEHAALLRLLMESGGHLVQPLEGIRGLDDELHRKTEGAGKRRRLERRRAQAGDVPELVLEDRLKLGGLELALAPGLEHHSSDHLIRDVELENVV